VTRIPAPKRIVLALAASFALATALADEAALDPEVEAFVVELVARHDLDATTLRGVLLEAELKPGIVERISRPVERTLSWGEYRRIFLGADRIAEGVRFVTGHRALLARAQATFGVPPEYVAAILGVETRYGTLSGDWRVLDALYTLGFHYPPRADFFRRELEAFLLLAHEEGKDPRTLLGSYAGAMGWGQFIPSSFRAYAVDFDGDGTRDIWANPEDAVGSIANYFAEHGWRPGGPVLRRVVVTDARAVEGIANRGLELQSSVAELRRLGVEGLDVLSDAEAAGLWRVEGESEEEFYATFGNFYVITRYNRSHLYALAVHDLAREIAVGLDFPGGGAVDGR
jgi:membrane-bound lytic murein transglycosylase B